MTLILYEVSFGQKSKITFIGAKLRFVIVYTLLLDEEAFISAVFSQWFCLWSILYCYLQWTCQVEVWQSGLFCVSSGVFSTSINFHVNVTTKANIPPHPTPAYSRVASTCMSTSQRKLTAPPHPSVFSHSINFHVNFATKANIPTPPHPTPPHPTPPYSRLASTSMTTSQRRMA